MNKRYVAAAMVIAGGGSLAAQPGPVIAQDAPVFDASQLPATKGQVVQYSLTPRGDVDGLILSDGTQAHLPPHLGPQLVYAVKPGDSVTIHGLRARAIPVVQAMSVTNDATGGTVTDNGPAGGAPDGQRAGQQGLTAQGWIKARLYRPQGDLNGALVDDGTIVRLPPPEAQRLAADLTPGAPLFAQGTGFVSPLGRVIEAQVIGPNRTQPMQIAAPPPPPNGPGRPPLLPYAPPPAPDTALPPRG